MTDSYSGVKLIAITKPLDGTSSEDFIAYCARVSNPSNQNNTETSSKLLKYLVKNKHWSPFELVSIVQEVNTTRDIARQLLRHRSFSFQEFSQRYADVNSLPFTTLYREARLQDKKNRQNSIETEDMVLEQTWNMLQAKVAQVVSNAYEWALDNGIAKEQARVVLPEGMTPSRLYVQGTLRSWFHYCQLRMGNGTQKEHRLLATEAWENILEHFPSLKDVLEIDNH